MSGTYLITHRVCGHMVTQSSCLHVASHSLWPGQIDSPRCYYLACGSVFAAKGKCLNLISAIVIGFGNKEASCFYASPAAHACAQSAVAPRPK